MEQEIEQEILSDIKKRFEIPAEKITLTELHPANFPADARIFRAEKRGSHGNIYYNYIEVSKHLYCSGDETSFQRLMTTEKLLTRPRWNAHQFAVLFLHLVVRDLQLVESSQEVKIRPDEESANMADHIAAPTLEITSAGATAKFWTWQPRNRKLEFWQVNITADYKVNYQRSN